MFDKYYKHSTEYVPYTKSVVEHKAPTDESIKLYGELVEKAQRSLLDSFELKSSSVDIAVQVSHNMLTREKQIWFKCVLNGQTIQDIIKLPYSLATREEMAGLIIDNISVKLSKALMSKLLIEDHNVLGELYENH